MMKKIKNHPCSIKFHSNRESYINMFDQFIKQLMPFTDVDKMEEIWGMLNSSHCFNNLAANSIVNLYVRFWEAVSLRDSHRISEFVEKTTNHYDIHLISKDARQMMALAGMAANYDLKKYNKVSKLWNMIEKEDSAVFHAGLFINAMKLQNERSNY